MNRLRTKLGVTSATIALGGSLALSGCSSEAVSDLAHSIAAQMPEASPTPEEPQNFCPPTSEDNDQIAKLMAEQCAQAIHRGHVALVGYGISMPVLTRLANDTERLMEDVTEGESHIDVVPVQATINQTISFDEVTGKCVDVDEVTDAPGYVANVVDETLNEYDFVIGATTKPACKGDGDITDISGTYTGQAGGRFITILGADTTFPLHNKTITDPDGTIHTQVHQHDAGVAVHELLHGYGLGHVNEASGDSLDDVASKQDYTPPYNVNLQKLLKQNNLVEYGDSLNIMGGSNPDMSDPDSLETTPLNTTQLAWLGESDVILGNKQSKFVALSETPTAVQSQTAYTLELAKPVTAPNFKQGKGTYLTSGGANAVYSKIIIEDPAKNNDSPGSILTVYLASDDSHDLVNLGTIFGGEKAVWNIAYGTQKITIRITDTGATLAATTV